MAGQITLNTFLQVQNDPLSDQFAPGNQNIAQTNVGVVGGSTSTSTSAAVIPNLTGLTTEGVCLLQNLDETNYILWGPELISALVVVGKLKPAESFVFRLAPSVVLMAQAGAGTPKLLTRIYED